MPTAASAASPQRKRALPTKPLAIQAVRSFTDLGAAANLAYNFVKAYAERAHAPKLAKQHARSLPSVAPKAHLPLVVFDIDATLLNESETGKAPAVPIKQTLELLKKLQKLGVHLALVTARLEESQMRQDTERTLKALGLQPWNHLLLAPPAARVNMAAVSRWKHSKRAELARSLKQPVVLSVGDQWGDLLPLRADKDIDAMDSAFGVRHAPFQLVRPHDGFTMWGLKVLDSN
jgi:predicted secreted acid phosphatase